MTSSYSVILFFQKVKTQFPITLSQYFYLFILAAPLFYISPIEAQMQEVSNPLTYSVAWKQTAAEHRALFHQGFNIATMRVQQAIAERTENESEKYPFPQSHERPDERTPVSLDDRAAP